MAKIKSLGFWEVIIRPPKFDRERISSLSACKDLIEKSKVQFRGWDYPHINSQYGIRVGGAEWVETLIDWSVHLEYWRMYKSAQFFHIFGCWEDWAQERIFWSGQQYTSPGYGLELLCTLYTLTEIYEFAARFAKNQVLGDLLKVSITLNGMKDRRLVTTEIRRSLNEYYVCKVEKIPIERIVAVDEIIGRSKEFAIDDTLRVFEYFNWFKPQRNIFEEEQDKFIRRIF